jgi:hypothetical protein
VKNTEPKLNDREVSVIAHALIESIEQMKDYNNLYEKLGMKKYYETDIETAYGILEKLGTTRKAVNELLVERQASR